MNSPADPINTIDEYIKNYPKDIRERLQLIRETVHMAAPDALEVINYGMPTFQFKGNLVHFAAAKEHIGFYPTPSAIVEFDEELKDFDTSKGTIKFPYTKPIPINLVKKITEFRLKQNLTKK